MDKICPDESVRKDVWNSIIIHSLICVTSFVTLIMTIETSHTLGILLSLFYFLVSGLFFIKIVYHLITQQFLRSGQLFEAHSYKILKIIFTCFYAFLMILMLIAFLNISLRKNWTHLPDECNDVEGCTMVGKFNSRRSGVNIIQSKITYENSDLEKTITQWLSTYNQQNTTYNYNQSTFIYAEFTIPIFGFIDDMGIDVVKCKDGKYSSVYSISEQRIGYYDFMVNDKRILDLYDFLNSRIANRILEKC